MPAGGRFNGGHASHQTGLDVDIFLQLPKTRWSQAQLLRPQALDLVSRDGKHVVPSRWSSDIASLIKLAAQDNDVTRIFVNPAIKQQLCLDAGSDRDWLRKVRPGSSIARICTCVYAALPTAWSAKINLYLRRAMDAALNCKAGSNRQNLAPQSLRRRYRRRCRLPARRYWMSMYSDGQFYDLFMVSPLLLVVLFLSPYWQDLSILSPGRRAAHYPCADGRRDVAGKRAGDQ